MGGTNSGRYAYYRCTRSDKPTSRSATAPSRPGRSKTSFGMWQSAS
ncbi:MULTISPECIES: hypothetical protein [unclassified Streptomyces]